MPCGARAAVKLRTHVRKCATGGMLRARVTLYCAPQGAQ